MSEEKKATIGGKKREQVDFGKKVGLFAGRVLCINPTREEYKELLNMELKEESKADEYLGTSKDSNTTLRVNVWLEELKTKQKFNVTFFLEDKTRENKAGDKTQYINNIGVCSWADEEENLPEWFKKRDYRKAFNGEEELYGFLRTWLGTLDYRDPGTDLRLTWKNLMKGNVKEIRDQIGGEFACNVVSLADVKTVDKDGETKEYQSVYNKGFLPEYSLKNFRLVDYSKPEVIKALGAKPSKDLKPHERFVVQVTHPEHGNKNFYILKDMTDYDPSMNFVASNATISDDDAGY